MLFECFSLPLHENNKSEKNKYGKDDTHNSI